MTNFLHIKYTTTSNQNRTLAKKWSGDSGIARGRNTSKVEREREREMK